MDSWPCRMAYVELHITQAGLPPVMWVMSLRNIQILDFQRISLSRFVYAVPSDFAKGKPTSEKIAVLQTRAAGSAMMQNE